MCALELLLEVCEACPCNNNKHDCLENTMKPNTPLPIDASWQSTEEYVDSLLTFVTTSELFRNLCGGVHVLDFLTRKPDLYSWVLPKDWRDWFDEVELSDILDLLLREDLGQYGDECRKSCTSWRNYRAPPTSLVEYVLQIRKHSLRRELQRLSAKTNDEPLPHHIAVGMKSKKVHEVTRFATYVDQLSQSLDSGAAGEYADVNSEEQVTDLPNREPSAGKSSTTIIDFGSGQNYLGRTLACPPHNKHVVAIEQRHHNVEGAKGMDVTARLAKKEKRIVNRKEWKAQWEARRSKHSESRSPAIRNVDNLTGISEVELKDIEDRIPQLSIQEGGHEAWSGGKPKARPAMDYQEVATASLLNGNQDLEDSIPAHKGAIQYVEKELSSGHLSDILGPSAAPSMVVSIHSCGNLTHHGLRSLVLNPSVRAVALVGCCYNLLTERLGPPTYKLPSLRSKHPRLEATSSSFDPHGFPMSEKLENFTYAIPKPTSITNGGRKVYNLNGELQDLDTTGRGVRLNITARMMAVQAPHNWGPKDSEDFFTRHYYRALLQRILLDVGVVQMANASSENDIEIAGGTLSGKDTCGTPLIIGSLRKQCFTSLEAYIRGAVDKLIADPDQGPEIEQKTKCLFEEDSKLIKKYEEDFRYAKKHLSIIWSLMAFSANVVESTILVDRWLWLKEQQEVEDAWVEAVFDYKQSPRNMVVVGIRKRT